MLIKFPYLDLWYHISPNECTVPITFWKIYVSFETSIDPDRASQIIKSQIFFTIQCKLKFWISKSKQERSENATITHCRLKYKRWQRLNRYNQVPHLTQDTKWESGKNTNITNESLSQQATTRQQWTDAKAWQTQDINNTNDPQISTTLEWPVLMFYWRALTNLLNCITVGQATDSMMTQI